MLKTTVKNLLLKLGYEVKQKYLSSDAHCYVQDDVSVYLPKIKKQAEKIPGMISLEEGAFLYLFACLNQNRGDIVEIGSWQGRSTVFLAAACKQKNNGKVHAIDPFTGNVGQEAAYRVGAADLSDLSTKFHQNIADADLSDWVKQYQCKTVEAVGQMVGISPRIVFIDGDHSYDGVKTDNQNFLDKIQLGGWVIYDDYRPASHGVVKAVEEDVLKSGRFSNFLQTENFFFAQKI